jgi:hypothetical protein
LGDVKIIIKNTMQMAAALKIDVHIILKKAVYRIPLESMFFPPVWNPVKLAAYGFFFPSIPTVHQE